MDKTSLSKEQKNKIDEFKESNQGILLEHYVNSGDIETIRLLLKHYPACVDTYNTDYFGETPLFNATESKNLEISKFLNSSELSQIPKNLIISNEDIDTLMDKCLITIFMSTAAAYNAVLNGNIVFNLRSELNFSDNYLDILEKDFKFVNSYSLDSIKQILLDFENNEKKIEEYKDEFKKIRQYFVSGFNQVNEVNLAKFK